MSVNENLAWTTIFVKQLSDLGVEFACIASGSRSTPLTTAFTANQDIVCYSHVDERSAAFFALGLAKETEKPVVVVSTSGTAAANFYPAIIEAKESNVPLIICSADRPHELRISGANQTMDQVKLYSDHVNWFVDVALPEQLTRKLMKYLQHLALQAVQHSLYPNMGPVHLNFPFRKPLEPTDKQSQDISSEAVLQKLDMDYQSLQLQVGSVHVSDLKYIHSKIRSSNRLMVVCGPDSYREISIPILQQFINKKSCLLVSDALSGMRYTSLSDNQIISYETFLQGDIEYSPPDLIILFGKMPISKYLGNYLSQVRSEIAIISSRSKLSDATLEASIIIRASADHTIHQLNQLDLGQVDDVWLDNWQNLDLKTSELVNEKINTFQDFEPTIISRVLDQFSDATLFIGNSLAVRHLDQFYLNRNQRHKILSNRGVSGIDGIVSSSLGVSVASDKEVILITGDLTFYHDLSGLLVLKRYDLPLKILLINNHGGAIFDRLPISKFDPPFQEFFINEHDLSFKHIADFYQMEYLQISSSSELDNVIDDFRSKRQVILEVNVSYDRIETIREKITNSIIS